MTSDSASSPIAKTKPRRWLQAQRRGSICLILRRASMSPPEPATPPPQTTLQRSQWERIDLAPDIELHVRRPLSRATAKQLDRLIAVARDLFAKENQP